MKAEEMGTCLWYNKEYESSFIFLRKISKNVNLESFYEKLNQRLRHQTVLKTILKRELNLIRYELSTIRISYYYYTRIYYHIYL